MRCIAAHFAWSPDNRFIHMPVIRLDDNNVVIDITEHGQSFTETAGVEFYNGLLIPGLIAALPADKINDPSFFLRMLRNGVLYLQKESTVNEIHSRKGYPIVIDGPSAIAPSGFPWENLIETLKQKTTMDAADWLSSALVLPWTQSGNTTGGAFEPGRQPGILQITGMNWASMTFTPHSRLQVIL